MQNCFEYNYIKRLFPIESSLIASKQQIGIIWLGRTKNCMLRMDFLGLGILWLRFCCTTGFALRSQACVRRGWWASRLWKHHGNADWWDWQLVWNRTRIAWAQIHWNSQIIFRKHPRITMDMPKQFASKTVEALFFSKGETGSLWQSQNHPSVDELNRAGWALLTHRWSTWYI